MIRTGHSSMLLLPRLVLLRSPSPRMRCNEMHCDEKSVLNALIIALGLTGGMKSSVRDEYCTQLSERAVRGGTR